ncbi:MAG: Rieske 2Fe-2S domain-containing protein [Planctomycetota bacterium]|nr:Rieske 2Fe-2S domain-containing protein [Planctomycetota bacterium]
MATKEQVVKVWIDPGCIVCDACETACPEVFEVQHDNETCIVRPEALETEFTKPLTDSIVVAAEECPVDVIKFDTVSIEVADAPDVPAAAAKSTAPDAPAAAAPEPAAASQKKAPDKPAAPPKPKELDPAIQALLAATTARGGRVVIDRGVHDMPTAVKRLSKLSPDELPPDARFQKVLEKSKPAKKTEPTRRDVLLGVSWATFAVGFGAVPTGLFVRFMMPNVLEEPDPKVRCGKLANYQAMQIGDVNEEYKTEKPSGFWIIREDDRIAALSIVCTHLGCVPNWLPNDKKFKCPCHGSGYDVHGVNFEGPTPRPLERFNIYLDGDEVIVDRSKKYLAMGPNDLAIWSDPDASIPV